MNPILILCLLLLVLIAAIFLLYVYFKWQALKKSALQEIDLYQQRAQLALDGADLGLWDWYVPTGKVFFNERWFQMLGYKIGEIASDLSSWQTLVHPDDWSVINPPLDDHLKGLTSHYESEHRLKHKEGHWVWVLDRGKVMERGKKGEPLRVVGTHLDITQRKKNQDYLETLLNEQRIMLNNEMIGIVKTRDSTIVWTNPAFEKILGFNRYELIGEKISQLFINEEAYHSFSLNCHPAVNSKSPFRTQIEQIGKGGKSVWVDLSCTIINEQQNELMGIVIDITEQKKIETIKLEALNRINKIASQLPGVVYQYCLKPDGSSCFPYASERIREIFRVNPEEVREDASKVLAILHPDDYQMIMDSILESAKNLSQWQLEYRVKFVDGTVRWLSGNSLPNKEADGSVLWHGFITDITESKNLEELLKETEKRNELILNSSELGTWDWNLRTGRVVINHHMAKLHGYSKKEFALDSSNWQKFVHPDDLFRLQNLFAEHGNNNSDFFNIEYRVRSKSGQWLWVLDRGAIVEYDENNQPLRIAGTEMDITARKAAEEALRISRERLHLALQGANDGLWDWNYETNEVYYSPRWKAILGYAVNDLPNTLETLTSLIDPSEVHPVIEQAKNYIEGKLAKFEAEFRMRHKDGRWVDILSRAKMGVDSEGKLLYPLRLVGTHVDISARKKRELKRIEQEKSLRLTLVREVHHRIKNNLQGITGILRQHSAKFPETSEPINHAISQMQSIAEIYGLQGQDALSNIGLSDLIGAISLSIKSVWKSSVKLEIPPDCPEYIIAENEAVPLALVLNELIINAVKHGKNSGTIKISLNVDEAEGCVQIVITNLGDFPAGFNFKNKQYINTGLNLVGSLLPPTGAELAFEQKGSMAVTTLKLYSPIAYLKPDKPEHD